MLRIPARAWLPALLSGGLQIVIFPKPALSALCWISVAPLLYVLLRGRGGEGELFDADGRSLRPYTLRQAFTIGWACGVLWWGGTCYWIAPVFHTYGNLPAMVAFLVTLVLGLILGMTHGLFALLVVAMARRATSGNRRPLFTAPFFWVAIEFFRDRVLGCPWNVLGNTQVDNAPFARISAFAGVYGLSFAIVLVNCAFVSALLLTGARRRNLMISAVAAAIALQLGVLVSPAPFNSDREAVLIQENVPVEQQWTPRDYDRTLFEIKEVSVSTAARRVPVREPGLMIWPESPAPFYISDPKFIAWVTSLARDTNSWMIVGATGETTGAEGERLPLNSALVVSPRGMVAGRYDKIHLVPFGEYVPFKRALFFMKKITQEVGEFARGSERRVFDLDGTKVGTFICYESSFPEEVREFAAGGAELLVNISNDGWYGETGAAWQHLQMARMRAIENDRWVLVATNTGITAAIDPFGRVVRTAERNVRVGTIAPFGLRSGMTFYTRCGDIFAWLCVVISLAAIFLRFQISARTMAEVRSA